MISLVVTALRPQLPALGWLLGLLLLASPLEAQSLAWDTRVREAVSQPGETNITMTFTVTNISEGKVGIFAAKPSCDCTVVGFPKKTPWLLQPGEWGTLTANIDLRGKTGKLVKSILIETTAGPQVLLTKVDIGGGAVTGSESKARMNNLAIAQVNRQLVFRGDCARCHMVPGFQKTGRSLYHAACGICHDAEHRASMVPDLRKRPHNTDAAYWRQWITHGKEGSLMPGFGEEVEGPLSKQQIDSLVELLVKTVPPPARATTADKP